MVDLECTYCNSVGVTLHCQSMAVVRISIFVRSCTNVACLYWSAVEKNFGRQAVALDKWDSIT